jgi:hypothetical protein
MNSVSENELIENIMNPANAIIFASHLFSVDEPVSNKEDWIMLNAQLLESIGTSAWLNQFLDSISLPRDGYHGHDIINPSLAIKISESLKDVAHPLISRDQWVQANIKLLGEIGNAQWLGKLLDLLEVGTTL